MTRKIKPNKPAPKKSPSKKAPKRAKRDDGFVTVDIDIDPETKEALDSVAKLAKVTFDQVVSVLLAMMVLKDAELHKTKVFIEG